MWKDRYDLMAYLQDNPLKLDFRGQTCPQLVFAQEIKHGETMLKWYLSQNLKACNTNRISHGLFTPLELTLLTMSGTYHTDEAALITVPVAQTFQQFVLNLLEHDLETENNPASLWDNNGNENPETEQTTLLPPSTQGDIPEIGPDNRPGQTTTTLVRFTKSRCLTA